VGGLAAACSGAPQGALYIAADGFPVGDPNPRIVSNPNPRWTGSVRTALRYRKLQLSGLLDIRHGGVVANGSKGALWSYGTHKDTENRATCTATACVGNDKVFGQAGWYEGPVAGPGANKAVPIGQNWYNGDLAPCAFTGYDEACLDDDGYVKLREVSVTFTLDAPWVQSTLGLGSIDLRVSGRNLKTWTKWPGFDPETSGGGSADAIQGSEYFGNPQSRSFVFTVTLNR